MSSKAILSDIHKGIISGDQSAFKKLYEIYFERLKFYGKSISPQLSMVTIEDEVQNLFLWMASNNYKLVRVTNFEVYLFSSFKKNVIRCSKKQRNKRIIRFEETTSKIEVSTVISSEDAVIKKEEDKENSDFIDCALKELAPKQREVVFLRFYVGMSFSEIADTVQLSEQIVRNYAYRSIKKIRAIMGSGVPISKTKKLPN